MKMEIAQVGFSFLVLAAFSVLAVALESNALAVLALFLTALSHILFPPALRLIFEKLLDDVNLDL